MTLAAGPMQARTQATAARVEVTARPAAGRRGDAATAPGGAIRGAIPAAAAQPQTLRATVARPRAESVRSNQPTTAPANIRIEIEQLRVLGYTTAQHARFMRALDTALRTLAAQPRDWSSLHAHHIARLEALSPRSGSTPEDAARELARRLFAHLPTAALATERHHA